VYASYYFLALSEFQALSETTTTKAMTIKITPVTIFTPIMRISKRLLGKKCCRVYHKDFTLFLFNTFWPLVFVFAVAAEEWAKLSHSARSVGLSVARFIRNEQ
jgi:hypothetical protein